ncbi:MAG TPA: glycosyltransferase family 4 protein [Terriglobales bacterium]|jgi:glycosyltransferase involved in cell wall biosynthesis
MRILYCNKYSFPFSGTEAYLFELMDLMRAQGHEVALFSMAGGTGEKQHRFQHNFVPQVDFKSGGLWSSVKAAGRAIYSWKARRCLRQMIREFKPDVAHVRNIYHHLSPSIFWELRAHKIPVVYHLNDFKLLCPTYNMVSRGSACERCQGGRFWHVLSEGCYAGRRGASAVLALEAYTHKWLKTYQNCVDLFLAPSEFVKQKLVEHGWDECKINVLPHFQKMAASISAPSPGASILYFGRLSAEKGIPDLLDAMQSLPDVKLRIAGEGPQRAELENRVNFLRLKNVEFLGQLSGDALHQAIVSSQFTVLPSRAYETFGKSIVESYACARPVIASDLGSRRELVRDGETGLLYPVGDATKLANAIARLVARPEWSLQMGIAGRDLVRTKYSPQIHYSKLVSLYQGLAKQSTLECSPVGPELVRAESVRSDSTQSEPDGPELIRQELTTPMKVAFIGGRGIISKYSGIETYYEEVGKRLAAKGHTVTVYCRTYFTPPVHRHEQMRILRLPAIRSKHLETLSHTLLSTIHAMFSPYDIVHFHALGPALFSFLPRLTGKKTVVTVQGLDWQRKKWGALASRVLRMGEQAAVRFPSRTMVVSRVLQDFYRARYTRETHYVPNGATIRRGGACSHLQKWGIEKGQYILFLGRFSPEKNCHLLIEAYERIQTPVKLVLAGGSSHSNAYAAELHKQANQNVLLLDWLSGQALDELLLNAMLFVLPSDLEGMSLALLDAMSAGICVLASDVPENRELVDGAGFTFAHGNVGELERMLRFLINNPALRESKARLGQRKVRGSYLWPRIADAVEEVYLDALHPTEKRIVPLPVRVKVEQKRLAA